MFDKSLIVLDEKTTVLNLFSNLCEGPSKCVKDIEIKIIVHNEVQKKS